MTNGTNYINHLDDIIMYLSDINLKLETIILQEKLIEILLIIGVVFIVLNYIKGVLKWT